MSSSHLRLAVESRGLSQAEKEINVNTTAQTAEKEHFSKCKGQCKGHEKMSEGHVQGPQFQ